MARRADETRLRKARKAIIIRPGQSASYYARLVGCHRYVFNTLLAMLNDRGFLLWEDDRGRLWPCGEKHSNEW